MGKVVDWWWREGGWHLGMQVPHFLLFVYLETCHYKFTSTRLVPFYTLESSLGPFADRIVRPELIPRLKIPWRAEPFESSHTPMIRPTEPSEPDGHATHRNTHPSATNPNPTAVAAARRRTRKTSKEE
jgi:hypothetical protein